MTDFLINALCFLLIFLLIIIGIDRFLGAKGYRGPKSDHFDGKKFHSYLANHTDETTGLNNRVAIFKWLLNRPKALWTWRNNTHHTIPKERILGNEIEVTLINHATVLIQTAGVNILTDPVWSKRVSPLSFIGPARFRNPGIALTELPPIDLVLISHNHYDHMDLSTLQWLSKTWHPKILVGLGNKAYLRSQGVDAVSDMDWFQKEVITKDITVVCAPGKHFSSRAFSDRNKTLWCGFIIETPTGPIYFAGDTAYGSFIEKLSEHYPNGFRLSLLPIGAFKPEWFMSPVHISPDKAMQIHQDLKVKTSIGIHWGTFHLADDKQDEPGERITHLVQEASGTKPDFRLLENGETVTLN